MSRKVFVSHLAVWTAVVALACSSGGSSQPSDAEVVELMPGVAANQLPYEPCAPQTEIGSFTLLLADGYTRVDGEVLDGVDPNDVPQVLDAAGSCQLLAAPRLTCAEGCAAATHTCGPGGECVLKPAALDLGMLSFSGLVVRHELAPNDNTKRYASPGGSLPHPGFVPGADVRAVTGGGVYPRFELRGWGVSTLVVPSEPVRVDPGADVALSWQAPSDPGPAHVHIELNINRHGSGGAWIECDATDTGAAAIPAALIDGLFERGTSGYPTLLLTRRTATSVAIEPGCVELLVASEAPRTPEVAGIRSCSGPGDCAPGQSCRPIELYCE